MLISYCFSHYSKHFSFINQLTYPREEGTKVLVITRFLSVDS